MAELADVLRGVADGSPPPTDSELTVLAPPDERSVGVLAFPGQNIIVADVSAEWVRSWLTGDDLSEPFSPQLLNLLAAVTGRAIGNVDSVLVARAHGRRRGLELTEITDSDHARLARARQYRAEVRAWTCPGGLLILGRGVAGRWEAAVEVDPAVRGFGLGRGLFGAALGLLPEGESVWAQVAPGNAASLRALLAAGYRPIGGEVLFAPREPVTGEPIEWFGSYLPVEDWVDDEEPEEVAEIASQAGGPEEPAAEMRQPAQPWPAPEPEPAESEGSAESPAGHHEAAQSEPAVRSESGAGQPTGGPRVPYRELAAEDVPFEPVHFRLPPIDVPTRAPRPVAGDARPIETSATTEELAAAEADAEAELDADEDTELTERDEPHS